MLGAGGIGASGDPGHVNFTGYRLLFIPFFKFIALSQGNPTISNAGDLRMQGTSSIDSREEGLAN